MLRTSIVIAALVVAGCSGVRVASISLPSGLDTRTDVGVIRGMGGHRSGTMELGDERARFERTASNLTWFEAVSTDRNRASYSSQGGAKVECHGKQRTVTLSILQGSTKPYEVYCRWNDGAELRLQAHSGGAGTREERAGVYTAGPLTLELRSVHKVDGSPLPLAAPIGYEFRADKRAVGAIELNGSTPKVWRPRPGDPLREPVTRAALILALLWDPAAL